MHYYKNKRTNEIIGLTHVDEHDKSMFEYLGLNPDDYELTHGINKDYCPNEQAKIKQYKELFRYWINLGYIIAVGGIDKNTEPEKETYRIQYAEARAYRDSNYTNKKVCPNLVTLAKFKQVELNELVSKILERHESRIILALSKLCLKDNLLQRVNSDLTLGECIGMYDSVSWIDYGEKHNEKIWNIIKQRKNFSLVNHYYIPPVDSIDSVEDKLVSQQYMIPFHNEEVKTVDVVDEIPEDIANEISNPMNANVVETNKNKIVPKFN